VFSVRGVGDNAPSRPAVIPKKVSEATARGTR
jgi:hypothetical protein